MLRGNDAVTAMLVARVSFAIALLLAASAASYGWLLRSDAAPSWLRNPIAGFVEPGATAWWLTLGGPFQTGPRTLGGIAWAAIANTAIWVAVVALARLIVRIAGHRR
jgi:hypothetical protein